MDKPKRTRHRISQRQRRWLFYFFTSARLNATQAAREAGYKWPNHSGPENLQKLRKYIDLVTVSWADTHAHPEKIQAWVDSL